MTGRVYATYPRLSSWLTSEKKERERARGGEGERERSTKRRENGEVARFIVAEVICSGY